MVLLLKSIGIYNFALHYILFGKKERDGKKITREESIREKIIIYFPNIILFLVGMKSKIYLE